MICYENEITPVITLTIVFIGIGIGYLIAIIFGAIKND